MAPRAAAGSAANVGAPPGVLTIALPGGTGVRAGRYGGGAPTPTPLSGYEEAALAARTLPGLDALRGGQVSIDFSSEDFWWGFGIGGGGVFIIMLLVVIVVA